MNQYTQLLGTYTGQDIRGWMVSEKFDGMCAVWDGGASRGKLASTIPYADSYKRDSVCTGLFSRYGNVIRAPDWWLDNMPQLLLLGELYSGDARQNLMSVVKGGGDWTGLSFNVIERIPMYAWTQPRRIRRMDKSYWSFTAPAVPVDVDRKGIFRSDYQVLSGLDLKGCKLIQQYDKLAIDDVLSRGGEGVVYRDPMGLYQNKRVSGVLKHKACLDAECVVMGYSAGTGRLEGLVGGLIVRAINGPSNGQVFNIGTGLSDSVRACPPAIGEVLTYKYRTLTNDKLPQEARL